MARVIIKHARVLVARYGKSKNNTEFLSVLVDDKDAEYGQQKFQLMLWAGADLEYMKRLTLETNDELYVEGKLLKGQHGHNDLIRVSHMEVNFAKCLMYNAYSSNDATNNYANGVEVKTSDDYKPSEGIDYSCFED